MGLGMGAGAESKNQSMQSFYVTDHQGNVMKVSKSTIFDTSNDISFMRGMAPTLNKQ